MAAAHGTDAQATSPRDSFTGVAARSVPVTRAHPLPLPTPPNSISPALPPHGLTAQLHKAKLEPVDSDLDLQDGVPEHRLSAARRRPSTLSRRPDASAGVHDNSDNLDARDPAYQTYRSGVAVLAAAAAADSAARGPSPPYESADTITPAMLAKYHLPEILLNHGPLAIRYIIGHLTASVPGFSFIPPAKSRRLVVAALEGRGHGAHGDVGVGGLDGDVEFEKVSWGVWGARRVGTRPLQALPSPPRQSFGGIPITSGSVGGAGLGGRDTLHVGAGRPRPRNETDGAFDREDSTGVSLGEVDNMSMDDDDDDDDDDDGHASASGSEAPDEDVDMNDDPDNSTDDEDWGAVGAAALRAGSYSTSAAAGRFRSNVFSAPHPVPSFAAMRTDDSNKQRSFSYNPYAGAAGAARSERMSAALNGYAMPDASDEQEREAVEALLRLGSV